MRYIKANRLKENLSKTGRTVFSRGRDRGHVLVQRDKEFLTGFSLQPKQPDYTLSRDPHYLELGFNAGFKR